MRPILPQKPCRRQSLGRLGRPWCDAAWREPLRQAVLISLSTVLCLVASCQLATPSKQYPDPKSCPVDDTSLCEFVGAIGTDIESHNIEQLVSKLFFTQHACEREEIVGTAFEGAVTECRNRTLGTVIPTARVCIWAGGCGNIVQAAAASSLRSRDWTGIYGIVSKDAVRKSINTTGEAAILLSRPVALVDPASVVANNFGLLVLAKVNDKWVIDITSTAYVKDTNSPNEPCNCIPASSILRWPKSRKVIVFLQGICSSLDAQSDPMETRFSALKERLRAKGYTAEDFLEYSYLGGEVSEGKWAPKSYSKEVPGQQDIYGASAENLHNLILRYRTAHPEVSFVLVGHSMGGLIGFQEVGKLVGGKIPPGPLASLVTLDSPLNGVSHDLLLAAADNYLQPCQLVPSGVAASAISALGGSPNTVDLNQKYALAAEARGMTIVTLGSEDDCLYNPQACHVPSSNSSGSQVILSASAAKLFKAGHAGRQDRIGESHTAVLESRSILAAVACVIGPQGTIPSREDIQNCLR